MEDGFGEALLNRFKRDKRSVNVRFNGHRQVVTGPPVIAEGYRELAVPDEVFAARQERKEVVTRVITRLLISLWYEKTFFIFIFMEERKDGKAEILYQHCHCVHIR